MQRYQKSFPYETTTYYRIIKAENLPSVCMSTKIYSKPLHTWSMRIISNCTHQSDQFCFRSKVDDLRSESTKNWILKFKTLIPKHITSTGGRCCSCLISQQNWGRIGSWHKSRSKVQIPTKVGERYPVQRRMFLRWIRTLSVRHLENGHVRTMCWDCGLEKKLQP